MYFSAAKSNYEDTLSTVGNSTAVERERREDKDCDKARGMFEKAECDGANKKEKTCKDLKKAIDENCFKNHVKPLTALFILALLRNFTS